MPPSTATSSTPPASRVWRLNLRALAIFAGLVVTLVVAIVVVKVVQGDKGQAKLLAQAKALAATKTQDDLAVTYLRTYLKAKPKDLEGLTLLAETLARITRDPSQMGELAKTNETLLRLDPEPAGPRAQAARRRLIEAHLAMGPFLSREDQKYGTAAILANELIVNMTPKPDASALRLQGRVLERLGAQGDAEAAKLAVAAYEKARAMEPKDVEGAEHLAKIYYALIKNRAKANAVVDDLLKVSPTAPAYLMASQFREAQARELAIQGLQDEADVASRKASEALEAAVKTAPKDLVTCLAAAEVALAKGRPKEARENLDRVVEADRTDYRYQTLLGVAALYENRADDAIESWSKGLRTTGGGEADLSWKLAYVLLQLGRIDEAEPLISQFRRLSGGDEPTSAARYLTAMKFLKRNQPAEAAKELEKGRITVTPALKSQYYSMLGQCAEATRDDAKALDYYQGAIDADPKLAIPRLNRARLLQAKSLDDSADELRRGLAAAGDDPNLLVALARLELRKQLALPPAKRSFADLDALLERGRKVAPGAGGLAAVRADRIAAGGQAEASADLLATATAVDKTNPELWLARAERLVALNRIAEALFVLDQASDPKNAGEQAGFRILAARIRTAQGHGAEAREKLVENMDRIRPDQRPALWQALGDLFTIQRDPKSARKAYAEWTRLLPDDPLPWLFVLEQSLADASPEALAASTEALAALKRIGGFYQLVGEASVLLRQTRAPNDGDPKDKDKGKDKDKTTAKEDPKARSARLAEAEKLIDRIQAEAPRKRFAYLLRGMLLERKDKADEAASAYEQALPLEGGIAVLTHLVDIYTRLKRDDKLELLRKNYTQIAPGLARKIAENYLQLGEKDRAEKMAREIASGASDSLDVRVWEARVLNTLGKPEEAEKTLIEIRDKHPDEPGPGLALMYFQVGRGQTQQVAATVEAMIAKVKTIERPEFLWGQCWRVVGNLDKAEAAYKQALERSPDDPRVVRGVMEFYAATGRTPLGETLLRETLARDPSQRWATRALALLQSSRKANPAEWRAAWATIEKPAPDGDLPEDRLTRALVLARAPEDLDKTRQKEAVAILKTLIADLPSSLPVTTAARKLLTQLLLSTEPAKAAELAAEDAGPAAAPDDLKRLATALIAARRFDAAATELDRLATLAPNDLGTTILRARLLKAKGQGDQAAQLLEKAADSQLDGPTGEATGRDLVRILLEELNDLGAAERVAVKLKAKHPKTAGVLGLIKARQGHAAEAMNLYLDAATHADPAAMREAVRNALSLIQTRHDPATFAQADAILDAARNREPKAADLLAMTGFLRHFEGRYDDEISLYETAIEVQPDDFSFLNNMAWTLSENKRQHDLALTKINEAIRRSPVPSPQCFDTRGVIYTQLGDYPKAIADLERSVADRPTGVVWAHLARAYYKAKLPEKFRSARDAAKKAGLTPEKFEKSERGELEPLIFGPDKK